jgi:hypothetical protein
MIDVQLEGARHELVPLANNVRWNAALEGVRHAFGHRWEHCHAFALSSGLPTYLYHFQCGEMRVICPLSERMFDDECDVLTPYGFAGFAGTGPIPGFAALWRGFAATQGWVCAYLQDNPLLYNPLLSEEPSVVQNTIYVLDLQATEGELTANMSANRRRQLRRQAGGRLGVAGADAADFLVRNAPTFFTLRSASPLYQFADETWHALLASPGVLALEARDGGELEALTVFGVAGEIADFMFNISTPNGRPASAGLLWEGVRRLRKVGCKVLNLGGGIRPHDEVAEFKRRFGAQPLPLVSQRQIFRREVFERLCRGCGVSPNPQAAYFPPYHAPGLS